MIWSVLLCSLLFAASAVIIRQHAPDFLLPVALGYAAVLLCGILPELAELLGSLFHTAAIDRESTALLLKAIAIQLLGSVAGDICDDCGIKTASGLIGLAVQAATAALALPLVNELLTLVQRLLS